MLSIQLVLRIRKRGHLYFPCLQPRSTYATEFIRLLKRCPASKFGAIGYLQLVKLISGVWFVMREKYCYLTGGWWLMLIWYERKALLAGWLTSQANRVSDWLTPYELRRFPKQDWLPCLFFRLCLVLKNFLHYTSHQIFEHMYETLNVIKKTNYTV